MERKRLTNCQRIHMMDVEKLAHFLFNEFVDYNCENCPAYLPICSNQSEYYTNPNQYECLPCLIKWLEMEC